MINPRGNGINFPLSSIVPSPLLHHTLILFLTTTFYVTVFNANPIRFLFHGRKGGESDNTHSKRIQLFRHIFPRNDPRCAVKEIGEITRPPRRETSIACTFPSDLRKKGFRARIIMISRIREIRPMSRVALKITWRYPYFFTEISKGFDFVVLNFVISIFVKKKPIDHQLFNITYNLLFYENINSIFRFNFHVKFYE